MAMMDLQDIVEDIKCHARGMWRFRWLAICIAWGAALAGWLFVLQMPNVYKSSARVFVDTNSLLPELTEGLTARENLMDEVELVSKDLLSRPNLEAVARETDLDLRATTILEKEELISELQQQIRVEGGLDRIFRISFEDPSRQKANEVVNSLLRNFVESSIGAQGDDADMTENALRLEIEDHERRLEAAESDLAEFKKRNLGYMPEDGTDYYTRLRSAQAAVERATEKVRLVTQRRDEIVKQLEGEEPIFGLVPSANAPSSAGCSKSGAITDLQGQLDALRVNFTDKHPRIVMLQETIASLEKECLAERAATGGFVALKSDTDGLNVNPVYKSLKLQLSNADVELAELKEEAAGYRRTVSQLRRDVDKISEVEAEGKRLNRDYEVIATRHQELLRRWESLQSKRRLDQVTDQVQFDVLEPPFAPLEPVAPNRPLLIFIVLILALGLGGAVAFALNQLRPVYFTRRELRAIGLPVLGSISYIPAPAELATMRRSRLSWMTTSGGLVATAITVVILEDVISTVLLGITGQGV